MTDALRSPIADELLAQAVATAMERDHLRNLYAHLVGGDCDDPHCPDRWAIWKTKAEREEHRAELLGTRLALAERAIRRLLTGRPADTEIAAWRSAPTPETT